MRDDLAQRLNESPRETLYRGLQVKLRAVDPINLQLLFDDVSVHLKQLAAARAAVARASSEFVRQLEGRGVFEHPIQLSEIVEADFRRGLAAHVSAASASPLM